MTRNNQTIYHDENGIEYVLDENGNKMPPLYSARLPDSSWALYDDSQGHCSFCGKLTCKMSCFK